METYTADDLVMISEMRLAVLASVDLPACEIDVVYETHCNDVHTQPVMEACFCL